MRATHRFLAVVVVMLAGPICAARGASTNTERAPGAAIDLGADLEIRPLHAGVWVHVSTHNDIPANGVLIELADGEAILADTPWTEEQTERLLSWAEKRGLRVTDAIATHSHQDCMGGADALRRSGVRLRALDLTVSEARERGDTVLPEVLFTATDGAYRDARGFEVFYAGAGHTRDNVVVWHPESRVVFGGCLVKSARSKHMGYIDEADLEAWPTTVKRVLERYADAALIVPGHGPPGGRDCIDNTLRLLEAHARPNR